MTNSAMTDWILVPREPTEAMIDAARNFLEPQTERIGRAAWTAMLAAAPTPQAQDVRELVARLRDEQHNDWTDGSWTVSAELADEAASVLQSLSATVAALTKERDEAQRQWRNYEAAAKDTLARAETAEATITELRAELAGVIERCAKVADKAQSERAAMAKEDEGHSESEVLGGQAFIAKAIAAAIRQLAQKTGK